MTNTVPFLFLLTSMLLPADSDAEKRIEALQPLNAFVGVWNGVGGPDKPKPDAKDPVWKETIDWSWRFKGDDAWLSFSVRDGKHIESGQVRYRPATKDYGLSLVTARKQTEEYVGRHEKGYLIFERTDKTTGEVQQLTMNSAGDGVRFVYRYAVKSPGRSTFTKMYQVAASKAGESLGAGGKKNECPVTGGLGTIAVTYKGETYWVCCTGCRDAFNEEPEKYVKAAKEKK